MGEGKIFIGTSGWSYPHWGKGVFYPLKVKQKDWLPYYSQYFDTVEINNTFYQLPQKTVFENWQRSVPSHFNFVVKVSRYITHIKKLNQPEQPLLNFLENASSLKKNLSLLLFQLPPFLKANPLRLKHLLDFLKDQSIASSVRVSFEFRNKTWLEEETFHLLTQKNVALCFADWPDLTVTEPITADFIYLRRHGPKSLYSSGYSPQEIKRDANQIKKWLTEGKDVYIYFNNDAEGWAIKNALSLLEMVK
jgi:uncharacterized protein YecE (DUF72 family)